MKHPAGRFSTDAGMVVVQLVKEEGKETSAIGHAYLGRSGQIKHGAGFDRLISSPKWLLLPHPARQYQPVNPARTLMRFQPQIQIQLSPFRPYSPAGIYDIRQRDRALMYIRVTAHRPVYWLPHINFRERAYRRKQSERCFPSMSMRECRDNGHLPRYSIFVASIAASLAGKVRCRINPASRLSGGFDMLRFRCSWNTDSVTSPPRD